MVVGPCTPYVTGDDITAHIGADGPTGDAADALAWEVSETLYVLLGRQYPGICQAKARPRRNDPEPFVGMPNFEGRGAIYNWGGPWGPWGPWGLDWCHANPVVLPDFLRSVDEVMVNGVAQVEGVDYYLDGNSLRPIGKAFPGWQKLWLPDTEDGTFSITYSWGPDTPEFVRRACLDYSDYLWLIDINNDTTCGYPQGTTSVSRQGQTVNINDRVAEARAAGPVLPSLNSAIGLANPNNVRAPSDYYSHKDGWRLVIQALETGS